MTVIDIHYSDLTSFSPKVPSLTHTNALLMLKVAGCLVAIAITERQEPM